MTEEIAATTTSLERVPTGTPGLDAVLHGGLFRGGVYMVLGKPGVGKTILGNQLCFGHVASGGRAVFVTLLTESHARMIAHMQGLAFFRPDRVGTSLLYVSGYQALEAERLKGLLKVLQKVIRDHKATFLVIDGLVTAGSMAQSDVEMKKFIHELQVLVELMGCTTLLLTGETKDGDEYPQRTMVDGLIRLSYDAVGMEVARSIEVVKLRGSPMLTGRHLFEISNAGLTVHPRTESLFGRALARPEPAARPLGFGIAALDDLLGGGLRSGSVSLVLGAPGTGKTLVGLSFLAEGARLREPGLYFGFFEAERELIARADRTGSKLGRHVESGLVDIRWQPPVGLLADALAEQLMREIRARKVRRLLVDGLGGLHDALVYAERARAFFSALCNELRASGVTALLTEETGDLFGQQTEAPPFGLSSMVDSIVLLRQVEVRAQLRRLISVAKTRDAVKDGSVRQFSIDDDGIDVSPSSTGAEAILRGLAPPDKARAVRPPRPQRPLKGRKRRTGQRG